MGNIGSVEPILGIDIGGTSIKLALVNSSTGNIISEVQQIPTPRPAMASEILELLVNIINEFKFKGQVGCGFPGVIKNGVICTAANLDESWIGEKLAHELGLKTGSAVSVINDADAAGLAEMRFGSGEKWNRAGGGVVLMITLGTGIGSALFMDGKLIPNTEFGHIEMNGTDAEKLAATVVREQENLDWPTWAGRVNKYLQMMERLLSPDGIIIGGGVSDSPQQFFPYLHLRTEVLPARMGNHAGIIGAALGALGVEKENKKPKKSTVIPNSA